MTRYLIVEDDPITSAIVEAIVGDDCVSVRSGLSGLAIIEDSLKIKDPFEYIILDLGLPEMDGLEFLKALRTIESKLSVPPAYVVVITGEDDLGVYADAHLLGCNKFLSKPVNPEELRKCLNLN
jgi:CheY-like chemotaxis protein